MLTLETVISALTFPANPFLYCTPLVMQMQRLSFETNQLKGTLPETWGPNMTEVSPGMHIGRYDQVLAVLLGLCHSTVLQCGDEACTMSCTMMWW